MKTISDDDKERIANSIQRTVAASTVKRIHNLIDQEHAEAKKLKRFAGGLGGLILGSFFLIVLVHTVLRPTISESFRMHPSFLSLYIDIIPQMLLATLPLSFSAYFLFNNRFSMLKCFGVGILVAVCISAPFSGYVIYNIP